MTQRGPWSVKGIDSRAREAAREAAREEGMTLGAYLNKLILEEGVGNNPEARPAADIDPTQTAAPRRRTAAPTREPATNALDRLARRIESAEARSTLAITGIDQSVVGLLSRLENAEHSQQAMGNHLESILEDIRKTYDALNLKVQRIEADDSSETNLKALKALEDALGKLASHVYEENELVGEETSAIKIRLESGIEDLTGKINGMESRIDDKVEEATTNFEKIIAAAELRTEGTAKHLAERFSAIEVDVANKLMHVEDMGASMDQVHANVTSEISQVNASLEAMQTRLEQAEITTNAAMQALEERFESLDAHLGSVQEFANEARFDALSEDLRGLVASTRAELAVEIEAASKSVDEEVLSRIEGSIQSLGSRLDASEDLHAQTMEMVGDTVARITESVDQRLSTSQDQQSRAIQQISDQMTRLSENLETRLATTGLEAGGRQVEFFHEEMTRFTNAIDDRLEALENRDEMSLDRMSDEVGKLTEQLETRLNESEQRSANAIEQIGQQVSGMARRLETRQAETFHSYAEKAEASQKKQEARLSRAVKSMSEHLERMQEQSVATISPVQRAIAALAQRLEAIEDFAAPPYAERGDLPAVPAMVAPQKVQSELSSLISDTEAEDVSNHSNGSAATNRATDVAVTESEAAQKKTISDRATLSQEDNASLNLGMKASVAAEPSDFEDGYESWADTANSVLDDTLSVTDNADEDTEALGLDDLAALGSLEDEPEYYSDLPPAIDDPLSAEWDDGRDEARDSDIFGDDNELDLPSLGSATDKLDSFEANAAPLNMSPDIEEDLVTRARRAAKAAANSENRSSGEKKSTGLFSNKKVGYAASALAIVALAGTAGVALYNRGKAPARPLSFGPGTTGTDRAQTTLPTSPSANDTINPEPSPSLPTLQALLDEAENSGAATNEDVSIEALETSPITNEGDEDTALGLASGSETTEPTLEGSETQARSSTENEDIIPVVFDAPQIPARPTLATAAADGNRIAQFTLGKSRLQSGDLAGGADLLKNSAEQGLAIAQHELAILYEEGIGVPRDLAEARRWHGIAARGGNVQAMFDFASFNANGDGGPINDQIAAEWFRKAAEFGHRDSKYNIGVLFEQGLGVSPSQVEALFWLELASRDGDADAAEATRQIIGEGRVSDEAARQVRARAAAWRPARASASANGQFGPQVWDGQSAQQIRAAQQVLNALGYDAGPADGAMGAKTRTAIRAFETQNGLPATGELSDAVVKALNGEADRRRAA